MSRPIRIEFAHALYHVTARGDRREDIFEDDQDRQMFLSTLGQVITLFNWLCHAWCLMHIYQPLPQSRSLEKVIEAIDTDTYGCFRG